MKAPKFLKSPEIKRQPGEGDLDYWRRSLFEKILYIFFISASIIIIPSAWGGFSYGVPFVGILDISVYLIICVFYFKKDLTPTIRHRIIELVFVVGITVLATLGPEGAGFVWLIGYCTFSTILFGKSGTKRSYLLVVSGLLILSLELHFGWMPSLKLHGYSLLTYSLTAINVLAVSLMINVAFNFILNRQRKLFLEQKRVAQKFEKKSAELQKSNENLDNLVYSISHDIRSPLANIKGLADLGRRDTADSTLKTYFHRIDQSAEKLQHFTRMVTQFFMVDKAELKPVVLKLKPYIDDLFRLNYGQLLSAKDSFRNHIPEDLQVFTDETRLTLILMNLMDNSIKYQSANRDLVLAISASSDDRGVSVIVEDNGEGIDQALLPVIFQMFTRVTRKSTGVGLGLYIVSQCVNTLKGNISVDSEKGKFTKFILFIPNL